MSLSTPETEIDKLCNIRISTPRVAQIPLERAETTHDGACIFSATFHQDGIVLEARMMSKRPRALGSTSDSPHNTPQSYNG